MWKPIQHQRNKSVQHNHRAAASKVTQQVWQRACTQERLPGEQAFTATLANFTNTHFVLGRSEVLSRFKHWFSWTFNQLSASQRVDSRRTSLLFRINHFKSRTVVYDYICIAILNIEIRVYVLSERFHDRKCVIFFPTFYQKSIWWTVALSPFPRHFPHPRGRHTSQLICCESQLSAAASLTLLFRWY